MNDFTGRVIGGFRIISAVCKGSGSQGAVYLGSCETATMGGLVAGQKVALKVMPVTDRSQERWCALEHLVSGLVRLSHPNVVKYYGCFAERDVFSEVHVVVQDFLRGHTLKDELLKHPKGLDADEAKRIVDSVLEGLAYVSDNGIVHRDVKPGNVFLCDDGSVKLIDFEIARLVDDGASLSSSGNLRGSFDYMAPEFADGKFSGDVRSDVFSVGVILHEALTGVVPYERSHGSSGQADLDFVSRWTEGRKSPIRVSSRVPRLLSGAAEVVSAAVTPDRSMRYRDFREFLKALRGVRLRDIRNGANTYRLLQFIGRGGFGEVFKARHVETGRYVAVKHLLKIEYAQRFRREAKVMARLEGDCFVKLRDFFMLANGVGFEAFLVMDFLDGMPGLSLRDAISNVPGNLPRGEVLRAFFRYAQGLAQMHRLGIYHRDIKPANLYYPPGNPSKAAIMDLGIARDVNGTATHGQVPGTLDYMPPEVITTSNRGDGGMDVFALGLCLYEALTGRKAYAKLAGGPQGYVAFIERAQLLTPPTIDARLLGDDQRLVSLIYDMTEPNLSLRIKNAEVVERRLLELINAETDEKPITPPRVPSPSPPPRVSPPSSPPPRVVPQSPQVNEGKTQPVVRRQEQETRSPRRMFREQPLVQRIPRKVLLSLIYVAAGLVLLVGLFLLCRPLVCERIARHQMQAVLVAYDSLDGAERGQMEAADWRVRWKPGASVWRSLPAGCYTELARNLETEKDALIAKWAAERERLAALDRIEGCISLGGRFNPTKYRDMDGWTLPKRLEDDREIPHRISALSKVLSGALAEKLAVEPVADRLERLSTAEEMLRNSWTPRLLSEKDRKKWAMEVERAKNMVAVRIINEGTWPVQVDGREIAANGGRLVLVSDKESFKKFQVNCAGFFPIPLPHVSGEFECRISDEMFKPIEPERGTGMRTAPAPAQAKVQVSRPQDQPQPARRRASGRVIVPNFDTGVSCVIDGGESVYPGKVLELEAGEHYYRYERQGFQDQGGSFVVTSGGEVRIPLHGRWLSVREAARERILSRCRALMRLDPVENRQDRLEQAGRLLTDAIAVKRLFDESEEPVRLLDMEINKLKSQAVGMVVNDCTADLTIGGQVIPAGKTQMLVFPDGLPARWVAELPWHDVKELPHDLEGLTLRFRDDDFLHSDIVVRMPRLGPGIVFLLDGTRYETDFKLKPGLYLGCYKREGFEDQPVSLKVPSKVSSCELPPPSPNWKKRGMH